ncbi:MAG: caspase family protein [Saprospiraceae bacterium]|nr:caspase family protein [Saprospiraceae bacterium]
MKTIYTLIALVIFAISIAEAQCISGNCQNGKGAMILPDGGKYIGEFQNGEITGEGACYYEDGSVYQGQWLKGYPHGKGVMVYQNGTRKEGDWRKGKLMKEEEISVEEFVQKGRESNQTGCISGDCINGQGIYIYPSKAVYIGEFQNGEIHGVGVCYYSNGSKYQGEWKHRLPDGKGTKTFPDGTQRTGLWTKDQPIDNQGNVILSLGKDAPSESADVQSGCLAGNCNDGKGTFAYPDGSKYEGQFRNGKPEGKGIFFYINNDRYEGNFRAGFPHGNGTLFKTDGQNKAGLWRDGEYIGETIAVQPVQTGCISGDCANGNGTYVFKNGATYTGPFVNNLPHGNGVVEYTNNERYEGEMAAGSFNGYGTLHLEDGGKVSGYWREGTYQGTQNPYVLRDDVNEPTISQPRPGLKIWAVIVGVASYNHMPALRYTDDDAYRIHSFLKSPEGGALPDEQIRILIDEEATLANIKSAMDDIFSRAGSNDMVMLYFSGHGLKGSFLPIDFDGFNNKFMHEDVAAILKKSPAKYKLCIADACHSGSLLAMRSASASAILTSYYETLAQAEAGTALIMSSKSEETSLESSGLRQGVFTHFLIRGLKGEADNDGNKIVSVEELFNFVFDKVRNYTDYRQSPVIMGDYDKKMPVGMKR